MATAENGSLQVKNNSRSISPAADALSLLEDTDDLQQTQIELTDNGLNRNENMQHPSVEPLTSTPIIQPSNHHSRVIKNNTNQTESGSNGVKNNFNSCDHKTHIENNEDNTSAESGRLDSDFSETCHSVETGSSQNERDSSLTSSGTQTSDDQGHFRIKLLGYEIIEERNKFTVFNIQVKNSAQDKWFLFRRYNDFVRLNDKLKEKFPNFQLALPPKRYLGDNYEKTFLKERQKALQAFLNLVVGHNEIRNSAAVQDFLCLDNPPGPHESLEESKALCESLEEEVYELQRELREKNSRISLLEAELDLQRLEIDNLKKSLKYDRNAKRRPSNQSLSSTAEHNTSADVDQQRFTPKLHSKECSPFRNSPVRDRITTSSPASIQETNEELPSVEDQVGTDQMM